VSFTAGGNKFTLGDTQAATGIVSIFGGTGDDSITMAASTIRGALTVALGSGVDTINISSAGTIADSVFGGFTGVEVIDLAAGSNVITLGTSASAAGIRVIYGDSGADSVNASTYTAAVTVISGDGADSIYLGSGNDLIQFGADSLSTQDVVALGSGNDTIQILAADSLVQGDFTNVTGAEVLVLANGANVVDLRTTGQAAGIVSIFGGTGADSVNASNYADSVSLYFSAGDGGDTLLGGAGNDTFAFSADSLSSGDYLTGGNGRDTLLLLGADTLTDTDFTNVLGVEVLQLASSGINIVALGAEAYEAGFTVVGGGSGADSINATDYRYALQITGGDGNDWITGGSVSGGDWIFAGSGGDTVYAGSGSDSVDGGAGADRIDLGAGSDTVYLGSLVSAWAADTAGDDFADLAVFSLADTAVSGSSVDAIFNFEVGLGADSIQFFNSGGLSVADSVSGWVEGGFFLSGSGADTVFASLESAISTIEANRGATAYDLDASEVFLFRVGTDSYIGTTNGTAVTSVIKLVGVGPAAASFDLKESSTTDGIFYIGPNGG